MTSKRRIVDIDLRCAECGTKLEPMPPEVLAERIRSYEKTYGRFGALPLELVCDNCRLDPELEPHAVEERLRLAQLNQLENPEP